MTDRLHPVRPFLARSPSRAVLAAALVLAACAAGAAPAAGSLTRAALVDVLARAEKGQLGPLDDALRRPQAPAVDALLRARRAAAALDAAATHAALREFDAAHDPDPAHRAEALLIAADADFAAGDYAAAARATSDWLALPAGADRVHEREPIAQAHGVAQALAAAPPQAVASAAPSAVPATRDAAGLLRVPALLDGVARDVVLDTGAGMSVVSASTAKAMHLRLLAGDNRIASSTRDTLQTRLGVADRVEIAGVTLANVAFLVLDDAALEIPLPGGYRIEAILGFPVFRALGRATFAADGTFAAQPEAPAGAGPSADRNLVASGNDLFVAASVNGTAVPLHLDTGASSSSLSAAFGHEHPDALRHAQTRTSRIGSAGGVVVQKVARLKAARLEVDGRALTLPELDVALAAVSRAQRYEFGTIGQDALKQLGGYAIDLRTMRLSALAPADDAPGHNAPTPSPERP